MLKEKNKMEHTCSFCSNFTFGFEKKISKEYSLKSKPMIRGKEVKLSEAIHEIKKILKLSNSIHIDGMDCDISTIDKIFSFAERHRCSVNHMDSQKINNLYLSYSKYGGSFVSLNEIKNRADLIMFLGVDKNQLCEKFLRKIKWSKKKVQSSIFFISPKQDTIHLKKNNLTYEKILENINKLHFLIDDKKPKKGEFLKLSNSFSKSKYPIIIVDIGSLNSVLTLAIYDLVYAINKKKRLRIYNLFGSNNSSGFVNSCVTKTGFPNAVVFTDNGAEYDPYQINSNVLMKNVDLQLYFSNFSETPNKNFFKKNIFLGNPNAKNKKKFDVYIPTKTPGVDKNGLSVRSDGISIIKHKQVLDSSYKSIKEILTQI